MKAVNSPPPAVGRPKIYLYTGFFLSLTAVSFLLLFALLPTIKAITGLGGEIETWRNTSYALDEKLKALVEAQKNYTASAKGIGFLNEELPDEPEFSGFLSKLRDFAQEKSVSLSTAQAGAVKLEEKLAKEGSAGAKELRSVYYSLYFDGPVAKITDFLNDFYEIPRLIKIENASIHEGRDGRAQLFLSAKIYYLIK